MKMLSKKELNSVYGGLFPEGGDGGGRISGGGTVYQNNSGQATGLGTSYSASGTSWADQYDQFNMNGIGSATSGLTYDGNTGQIQSSYDINGTGSHDIDLSSAFNTNDGSQSLTFDLGGNDYTFGLYENSPSVSTTYGLPDGSTLTGTANTSGDWMFDFNTGDPGDNWSFDISIHGDTGGSWNIDGTWHF